jgi:hypothetical protein
MKLVLISVCFLVGFEIFSINIGCNTPSTSELAEEELKDSLMVIHDEVMPRMSELHQLKKELNSKKAKQDADVVSAVDSTLIILDAAAEGMMGWMHAFKKPASMRSSSSHEEIMAYLTIEKLKVEKVRDDINASIKRATDLINALNSGSIQ